MTADTLCLQWEHSLWSGWAFQISKCHISFSDDPEQCVTHCHRMRTIGSPFTQVRVHACYKEDIFTLHKTSSASLWIHCHSRSHLILHTAVIISPNTPEWIHLREFFRNCTPNPCAFTACITWKPGIIITGGPAISRPLTEQLIINVETKKWMKKKDNGDLMRRP